MSNDDLKKKSNKIGLFAAISYTIGDIIGSGIFISPTSMLKHTGSVGLSLIGWALCAIIAMFGAACYIELGTCIRKSGNDYAYLMHFGWRPLAVAFLWVTGMFTSPAVLAIQSRTLGNYVVAGLKNLLHIANDDDEDVLGRLTGFLILWILIFINFFSLKHIAGRFQMVATVCKLAACTLIISLGFYALVFKDGFGHFNDIFANSQHDPGEIVLGLYAGLFAYGGWDILNYGTEEVENPKRTLPIAAFIGILISAVVFISMNIAYFSVLTLVEFRTSHAIAVDFAMDTLGRYFYIVPFLIALLLVGNLNTTIFASSRYLFAAAKSRTLPAFLSGMHMDSGSPRVAITVQLLLCLGVSFLGDLDSLISYMSFASGIQRTVVQVGMIYGKWNGWPVHPDGLRLPLFFNFAFLFISFALLVIPVLQSCHIAIYAIGMITLGLCVHFAFIYPKRLPDIFHAINDKVTILAQIVFNVMPCEYASQDDVDVKSNGTK